ncbi:MAG: hypothetical protein AAF648_09020 [Pseudomonadota bacterium]
MSHSSIAKGPLLSNPQVLVRWSTLVCVSLLAAGPALAASDDRSNWRTEARRFAFIDRYDADDDGRVSSVEFEAARRARFDLTDENQDGWVSEDEYVYEWEDRLDAGMARDRAAEIRQTRVRFDALDRSDDKQLTQKEFNRSGKRMFTGWDTDKNGVITAEEPPREQRRRRQETAEDPEARRARMIGWATRMYRPTSTHSLEGMIEKYDTDGDGTVTRLEFDTARQTEFSASDEDGNGWLSEEEYVLAYEDRLDTDMQRFRVGSVKQAGRRFDALDDNDDAEMSFAEYQQSGHRMFARWDRSEDGFVSADDPNPIPREQLAAATAQPTTAVADTTASSGGQ